MKTITPTTIRKLRLERGVSQAALAKELGIQRSYLSLYENGKYMLSDRELDEIVEHLQSVDVVTDSVIDVAGRIDPVIRDGFMVPGGLGDDDIEALLNTLEVSLANYVSIVNEAVPSGFFGVDQNALEKKCLAAGGASMIILTTIGELRGQPLEIGHEGTIGELFDIAVSE